MSARRGWLRLGAGAAIAAAIALALAWRGGVLPFPGADGPRETLELYGNVERREVGLAFRVPGRIAEMRAEEGDAVSAGQVLALLDRDRYRDALDAAEARVEQQQAVLDELESGTRKEEIEQARARMASAEATLKAREREFERVEALQRDDFASQRRLDEIRALRDEARAALRVARADLDVALEGPREERIRAARARLAALSAERAGAAEELEDSALIAPADGIIRSRIVEPGAVVDAGRPAYLLAKHEPLWVRAYVAEPDLGLIAPGMSAEVVTDTRPDRPYPARVGFISPTAEFTPKTVHTPDVRTSLVYRIRVVVERGREGLRQGMPVTVRIPLQGAGREAEE
ncbi:MAG: efflux RND transporter periplasmic adaptor subunit [Pseudomonadota bacterium]